LIWSWLICEVPVSGRRRRRREREWMYSAREIAEGLDLVCL
jgi:hypothetical protein